MRNISRFLLLADIAVLVFIRFPLSYAWVFYLLAALLVPLTFFFYIVTFHVSLRDFIRLTGDLNAFFVGTVSYVSREQSVIETGERKESRDIFSPYGRLTYGKLGVADNQICFAARKGGDIEIMFSAPLNTVAAVEVEADAAADGGIEKETASKRRGRVALVLSNGDSFSFASGNCIAMEQRITGLINSMKQ
jgi:hypothetical protein